VIDRTGSNYQVAAFTALIVYNASVKGTLAEPKKSVRNLECTANITLGLSQKLPIAMQKRLFFCDGEGFFGSERSGPVHGGTPPAAGALVCVCAPDASINHEESNWFTRTERRADL
jgi:hypothetical protein